MNRDIKLITEAYKAIREQTMSMDSLPKFAVDPSYYKKEQPLQGFIVVTQRGGIDLNEQVLFEFDKSILTPRGKALLRDIAQKVVEFQKTKGKPDQIKVFGYTDLYGSSSYNQQLSMSRATAVAEELKKNGIQIPISTSPMGMKNPKVQLKYDLVNGKAPQQGIDQQQPNRRVEIEFNPPLPELTRQITQIQAPKSQTFRLAGPGYKPTPEEQKTWDDWKRQRGQQQAK